MDGPMKKRSFVNENIVKNGRFAKRDGHLKIVGRTKLFQLTLIGKFPGHELDRYMENSSNSQF